MSTRRLPLVAVTAIALAVAAPAAAVSGYPLLAALHSTTLTAAKTKESKDTCQAGRDQAERGCRVGRGAAHDPGRRLRAAAEVGDRAALAQQATASALELFG